MRVNAVDLVNANSSNNLSNLKNVSNYSKEVTERILDFIDNSKNSLSGSAFDVAIQNLANVTKELNNYYKKGLNLCENIVSANNVFSEFVSPDASLDDEHLDELRNQINDINRDIESVYRSMRSGFDSNIIRYSNRYIYQIRNYENQLADVNRLIDKISQLKTNDNAAANSLGD